MKRAVTIKGLILEIICISYALLFIYAATSKLFEFENFRIQLGQSPLLSAFANWVAIAVPVSEFLIAFALLFPGLRFLGLFASYTLMTMFSAYIYILLNYSAFVPCSCGGILEKMTWEQHLAFNIFFVFLAGMAIMLFPKNNISNN
jgi:uncharacterized membrane protein YphA (DoxX/SURF4 family)